MDGISVLWIQSRQSVEPTPVLSPPPGWRLDLLVAAGRLPEFAWTGYTAVVLDFSAGPWTDSGIERLQTAAGGPIVISYDPNHPEIRRCRAGYSAASTSEAFSCLAEAIEREVSHPPSIPGAPKEDWERLLVGDSHPMRQVGHIIRMVGGRRATVLITGETGSGKEVAARALHLAGPRRNGPLVAVNCSALPENLLEAELFGHVRGAFTGAAQNRTGRFEQANGGTLFLDEIGDLPLDLQAKLLRALQEREIQRLGSSETIHIDVRVVAATNCDLRARMDEERFREDLYYRLNVVPIHMPPLRARREDIPALAAHFMRKICAAEGMPLKRLADGAVDRLMSCEWPGNVRQLENALEMAIALSGERQWLGADDFPLPQARARPLPQAGSPTVAVPDGGLDYERTLALIERSILEQALRKTGGNKKAAAEMLRLKRTTLSAKVRNLDSWAARN